MGQGMSHMQGNLQQDPVLGSKSRRAFPKDAYAWISADRKAG